MIEEKMNIEEMKAFAALTNEEREKKIKIAEAAKKAEEDFYAETFDNWGGTDYSHSIADCGCGDTYWSIDETGDEQKHMCFCFDRRGKIGSGWEEYISLGSLYCTNCRGRPKMPEWYLEDWMGDEE